MKEGKPLCESADKAGMSEKTARKYLKKKRLPSEMKEASCGRVKVPSRAK